MYRSRGSEKALSAAASSAMCSHNHPEGVKGFDKYMEGYRKALKAEKVVADE